jgi:iron complex outermembrane receptor protein
VINSELPCFRRLSIGLLLNFDCSKLLYPNPNPLGSPFTVEKFAILLGALGLLYGPSVCAQVNSLPTVVVTEDAFRTGAINLDDVSSTASHLNLTSRETPAAVYLIDRPTFFSRGDRTTQEILRNVPGITATTKPDIGGSLSYRGFSGSQLTQLFNGIAVQYDTVAARPVDSWIYDRVEVIGGTSSLLSGAGAIGGSVNYITKLPERSNMGEALLGVGSFGTSQSAIGINRRISGNSGDGNFLRIDANDQRTGSAIEGNVGHSRQIAVSLVSDLNQSLVHTLALEHQYERLDRPYWGTPLLKPTIGEGRILEGTRFKNYNSFDGKYDQTVNWFRSILDYRASDAWSLKNTFYHYSAQRNYQDVEEARFNDQNTQVIRYSPLYMAQVQSLVGNRIEAIHKSDVWGRKSDTSMGIDFSSNKQTRAMSGPTVDVSTVNPFDFTTESFFSIPGVSTATGADRDVHVNTLALFLENRTVLTPKVSLLTGLRKERIDLNLTNLQTVTASAPASLGRTYSPTTGRLGLVFDLTSTANLYAQYATAADPPSGALTIASFSEVKNNTELTTGKQFEVGSKFSFMGGRATGTVAAYRIERKNIATPDPLIAGATLLVGQQSSRGIEASVDAKLSEKLSVQANLAFVSAKFDRFAIKSGGNILTLDGYTPRNTPKRVISAWISYVFNPEFSGLVNFRSVSDVYGDNLNKLTAPGYLLVDLGADFRVSKSLTITGRLRNLTNRLYATNVSAAPMFYLGAPRSAVISAHLNF